jgi:hypothetical protein
MTACIVRRLSLKPLYQLLYDWRSVPVVVSQGSDASGQTSAVRMPLNLFCIA